MKISSGIYWDRGSRVSNQDSIALQQVVTNQGRILLALVSDGIGGLQEGETASGYITERLTENFYKQMISLAGRRKGRKAFERSIFRCLCSICEELKRYAGEREIELGATISLFYVWKRKYLLFHLGDSRIYLCRKRRKRLLTTDHSDGKNGLTKCLGSFPFQYPDIHFGRIWGRCGFLLCTDGFYRRMDVEALELLNPWEISGESQIEKRLQEIAGASRKKGEKDNLSAVYIMVR